MAKGRPQNNNPIDLKNAELTRLSKEQTPDQRTVHVIHWQPAIQSDPERAKRNLKFSPYWWSSDAETAATQAVIRSAKFKTIDRRAKEGKQNQEGACALRAAVETSQTIHRKRAFVAETDEKPASVRISDPV